jgi:hypothetical protein
VLAQRILVDLQDKPEQCTDSLSAPFLAPPGLAPSILSILRPQQTHAECGCQASANSSNIGVQAVSETRNQATQTDLALVENAFGSEHNTEKKASKAAAGAKRKILRGCASGKQVVLKLRSGKEH